MNIVPFINQVLFTLAMLAAWSSTKVDDTLVRILQVIVGHQELTDLISELLDQLKPIPTVEEGLKSSPAALTNGLSGLIQGELQDQHGDAIGVVEARFSTDGVKGHNDAHIKSILKREGIDWQKWIAYLPMVLQILSMIIKK